MGNMVAFSVNHDLVGGLGCLDFDTIGQLHNQTDNKIKVSAASDIWLPELCEVSDVPAILSSYYHHADGGADLLFTNQWMVKLPYRLDVPAAMSEEIKARRERNEDQDAPHDSKTLIKALRHAVKRAPIKHPIHLQRAPAASQPPNLCQSGYSVFGYLTDRYSEIEKDVRVIPEILDICLTGRVSSRLRDHWSNIRYFGSFPANVSCLVTMQRNSFSHFALPFRNLEISPEEQAAMVQDLASRRYNHADNALELAGMNAVAQCFGFEVARGAAPARSAQWEPK